MISRSLEGAEYIDILAVSDPRYSSNTLLHMQIHACSLNYNQTNGYLESNARTKHSRELESHTEKKAH